jgi:glycosyltransferase involved in cell wall biosynthesis
LRETGYIVVIPSFNEPDILRTLTSLNRCYNPSEIVEVIIVVNSPEGCSENILAQNRKTCRDIENWKRKGQTRKFYVHCIFMENLPVKHAGAGLARKIGMDEAVYRFNRLNKPQGVICSFDADTICKKNYFTEIEKFIHNHPTASGASVYFEHPIAGDHFPQVIYHAVTLYELHMRYFFQALRSTGFPYAHHSLGSAFFVNAETYAKFGGMNRKKAGEDFYFLQKIIPNVEFYDLKSTTVYPSPRISDRVPFGTGPTIKKLTGNGSGFYYTYNYRAFLDLRILFLKIGKLFTTGSKDNILVYQSLPLSVRQFVSVENFCRKIREIKNNTSSTETFEKRFYNWFNELQIVKFLNSSHPGLYSKIDVVKQAELLLNKLVKSDVTYSDSRELLMAYRKLEKETK